MLQRHPSTAFGGMWAFPGGVVEAADVLHAADGARRGHRLRAGSGVTAAAARSGRPPPGRPWRRPASRARSTTSTTCPTGSRRRARRSGTTPASSWPAPRTASHAHDDREHIDSCWIRPADALERHQPATFELILPTLRNLEAIGRFATVAELLDAVSAAGDPRAVDDGGGWRILLPGDPRSPRERRRVTRARTDVERGRGAAAARPRRGERAEPARPPHRRPEPGDDDRARHQHLPRRHRRDRR